MDLDRMQRLCERDQWHVDDLDWTVRPRPMSRDDEMAICQLFTDMAGIERLAKALFEEQARRVSDPRLKAIFRSFVVDEERHAVAAERLAAHYDVHHYRVYRQNPSLVAFAPHFVNAVRYLEDDVANVYITTGEVILDVALLRSINDHVHDAMSAQAMELINRDESRHIAVDYHMVEHYASPAFARELASRPPRPLADRARGAWAFANVLYHAKPFIQDVFMTPMALVDPSGRRIREAFKRIQVLSAKEGVTDRPFGRFLKWVQDTYATPVVGALLGRALGRVVGLEPEYLARMNSPDELSAASRKTFAELADDVLAVKYGPD